jgi:hypothetical protein
MEVVEIVQIDNDRAGRAGQTEQQTGGHLTAELR